VFPGAILIVAEAQGLSKVTLLKKLKKVVKYCRKRMVVSDFCLLKGQKPVRNLLFFMAELYIHVVMAGVCHH
jgi:hypothetical protein